MARILPLKSKYYGTEIALKDGNTITVWLSSSNFYPSLREVDAGWTQEDGYDHVETAYSYSVAEIIEHALNKNNL